MAVGDDGEVRMVRAVRRRYWSPGLSVNPLMV